MSRLDDELRVAFKRKDPPPDFLARVLARLDEPAPQRKTSWRAKLASVFEMPRMRFAGATVAACLMIAVAAVWYFTGRERAIDPKGGAVAETPAAPASANANVHASADTSESLKPEATQQNNASVITNDNRARKVRQVKHRRDFVALRAKPKRDAVSAEALAAKEKVLMALKITSDTLNDVQRVIQKESSSRGESERNR
jgi:preprotein translocase subunit SecF